MQIDLTKVDNISFAGINHRDAPDYCDAYIQSADINGVPATEAELDFLNSDTTAEWRYEKLMDWMH